MEDGRQLFEQVLETSSQWANEHQLMYVTGATRPQKLAEIRQYVPNHFFLVPGVGAQGGSLSEVCKYGLNSNVGLLINSSRAIIYADNGRHFDQVAGEEASKIAQEMKEILQKQ
jgi:orotidine-5'-phosphate decarboxylase